MRTLCARLLTRSRVMKAFASPPRSGCARPARWLTNVFFREAVLTALADTVGSGALLKTAVLANIDSLLGDINAQLND